MLTRKVKLQHKLLLMIALISLSACGGGGGGSDGSGQSSKLPEGLQAKNASTSDFSLRNFELISSVRINESEIEESYRATLSNEGFFASSVSAVIESKPEHVELLDGSLDFFNVGTEQPAGTEDTFAIRRNLQLPFSFNELSWRYDSNQLSDALLKADTNSIRLAVGESYSFAYDVLVQNSDSGQRRLNTVEQLTSPDGIFLDKNNSGSLSIEQGRSNFELAQTIHASAEGSYELTFNVSIPELNINKAITVAITVYADDDGDGVENRIDLCPGTVSDILPENNGCAAGDIINTEGFVEIDLELMKFKAHQKNVVSYQENGIELGLQVSGTILLETPLGVMPIYETDLIFEYGAGPLAGIEMVHGTAQVPFPTVGILEALEISKPVQASIGYDYGSNLVDLGAPLNDNQRYLFFDFSSGLEASIGPLSFEAPVGKSVTFVLDPFDPFFFLDGDLPGFGALGKLKGLGIGMSAQGLIPFTPATTYAIGNDVGSFQGHLYLKGVIPFKAYPMELDGELVVNFDPDKDGATFLNDPVPDIEYGGNGDLNVAVDFLEFFSFGFPLGNSSMGMKITAAEQNAYFSGVLQPDTSFLPQELVPIKPNHNIQLAGLLSNDLARSFVKGKGEYNLNAEGLGKLIGVNLNNLAAQQAELNIDKNGVLLKGTAGASIHPAIDLGAQASLEAKFTGHPEQWIIKIGGDMSVAGVGLKNVAVTAGYTGLTTTGSFVTPISSIDMSGMINDAGVDMRGHAEITIPISVLDTVTEWVVDGAICGYEVITDSAICGVNVVVDVLQCAGGAIAYGACRANIFSCNSHDCCKHHITCEVAASCEIAKGCNTQVEVNLPKGEFKGGINLVLGNSGVGGAVTGEYCFNGNCTTITGGRVKLGARPEACVTIPGIGKEFCVPF